LRHLFYILIFSCFATLVQGQSRYFETTTFDYGTVEFWDNQPAVFKFTNTGKKHLVLMNMHQPKDVLVHNPKRPVPPGESDSVVIFYYTEDKGSFRQEIPVFTNLNEDPIKFVIKGKIKNFGNNAQTSCPTFGPRDNMNKIEFQLSALVIDRITREPIKEARFKILQGKKTVVRKKTDGGGKVQDILPIGLSGIEIIATDYIPVREIIYLNKSHKKLVFEMDRILPLAERDDDEEFATKETTTPIDKKKPTLTATVENPKVVREKEKVVKGAETELPIKEDDVQLEKERPTLTAKVDQPKVAKNTEKVVKDPKTVPSKVATIPTNNLPEDLSYKMVATVIDEVTGLPIEDAELKIIQRRKTVGKDKSDDDGVFMKNIPGGHTTLLVTAEGYEPNSRYEFLTTDNNQLIFKLSPIPVEEDVVVAQKEELPPVAKIEDEIVAVETPKVETKTIDEEEATTKPTKTKEEPEVTQTAEEEKIVPGAETEPETKTVLKEDDPKEELDVAEITLPKVEERKIEETLKLQPNDKTPIITTTEEEVNITNDNKEITTVLEKEIPQDENLPEDLYSANNVVFVIDVSTSMKAAKKLPLLKTAIKNLVSDLREIDKVAIVTYATDPSVVLSSTKANNKDEIYGIIDSLTAGGLTFGVKGVRTAYGISLENYIINGNNQLILATDGLFERKEHQDESLFKIVRTNKNNEKIKFSVIGFGDDKEAIRKMKRLANEGSGNYIYIPDENAASETLIEEIKQHSLIINED